MKEVSFTDIGSEYDVTIICSSDLNYLQIARYLPNGESFEDSASGEYRNAKVLSEALRDAIGYGPARDLLKKYSVDDKHPLMYLGVYNR